VAALQQIMAQRSDVTGAHRKIAGQFTLYSETKLLDLRIP
jgi:hypothetical protein